MNRTLASFRPFTHLKSASEPIEIVKAKDSLLFDRNGKRYIDAIASWWVITHGHCHPHIVNAVKVAAERLDQIVFANFTHAPARALLDELSHMLPEEFVAAFFSDNGSTDVLKAARAKGILVIFDEVMTGFYRTGYRFAFEALNFVPDILCLSKGLTGGFLPLSLTLCHDKVFQQFWHDDKARTFFHGHTFTANPLSCAAAAANLQLMGDSVEKSVSSIEQLHRHRIENIKSSLIKEKRMCGTIAILELHGRDGYLSSASQLISSYCMKHGVFLRPIGNIVYIMPPFCITDAELSYVWDVVESAISIIGDDR